MQKVGIYHAHLDRSAPWELGVHLGCTRNPDLKVTQRLAVSFVILDFFGGRALLSSQHLAPSSPWPPVLTCSAPFTPQPRWLIAIVYWWAKTFFRGAWKQRHICLTWGARMGNPHLLYFPCRHAVLSAGHTCRCSLVNLYERVVC